MALKTLRLADDERLAALQHEARLLAKLEHPNLVRVFTWRTAGDDHYLVMQFVAGGSLADLVRAAGPLPWQMAARYTADVGEALTQMHTSGLVHRDVKPANILLDEGRGEAILTDLGVTARLGEPAATARTLAFMPPEAFNRKVLPAGDVFALAATLFTLMTNQTPFISTNVLAHATAVSYGLPTPDPRLSAVPEAVEKLVRAGLAAVPDRRPDMATFIADLRALLNHLLADALPLPASGNGLRLTVERWDGVGFTAVPAARPARPVVTRDLQRVPAVPASVGLRTGDRVRVRVASDRPAWVTVFNVGPTGNLNPLMPATAVGANAPVDALDAVLTPPAGRERVFAVWTSRLQAIDSAAMQDLVAADAGGVTQTYRATRDLQAIQQTVAAIPAADRAAAVLELDHRPG